MFLFEVADIVLVEVAANIVWWGMDTVPHPVTPATICEQLLKYAFSVHARALMRVVGSQGVTLLVLDAVKQICRSVLPFNVSFSLITFPR